MNYELFMGEALAEARNAIAQGERPNAAVAVVGEAMVAWVLAEALHEKLGGDSLASPSLTAEEIRELILRAIRAHDRMAWLGQCFCGADNPKMRGADR